MRHGHSKDTKLDARKVRLRTVRRSLKLGILNYHRFVMKKHESPADRAVADVHHRNGDVFIFMNARRSFEWTLL